MNNNEILEEFEKYWEENITNFESGILRKKVKSFLVQVLSDKDKLIQEEELCHCSGRMQKEFCFVHNSECSLSLTDTLMPRAGICNKCTQSLAGMEHCRGKEMGCDCDCVCKHLQVDWEMRNGEKLNSGTCIKCGEHVNKI